MASENQHPIARHQLSHVKYVQHAKSCETKKVESQKQNVTISLSPETIRKAKILAARQSTSISRLLAQQLEMLIGADEAYWRAERSALALLEQGFHLGGLISASRDELHER